MKFELRDGLIYARLVIEYEAGSEVNLTAMIDTGSAGTAVDIEKFPIDPFKSGSKIITMVGVGGRQEALSQQVVKLSVDKIELLNYEVQFCDLWDSFGFEAIIGGDLLEVLGAVIDYPEKKITFTKKG